jgi:hypothetical protein
MEEVIAIAIGVLAASGVWLVLRPRTFQVVMGLCLLSYGVNLFIFSMGSLFIGKEPIIKDGVPQDLLNYTDPAAPGPGAHCDRDQLRHDRAVPGGLAGLPGPDRHRPCGRPGAQGMSLMNATDHRADSAAAADRCAA